MRTVSDAEKIRLLPWILSRAALNSSFFQLTFGASIFVLFLSELGLSKTNIGFLRSLLPFAGILAPFIAPAIRRFGYKRTFMIFYGSRKWILAALALAPVLAVRVSPAALLVFLVCIIGVFALFRSIAETAEYPWMREYIPDSVRGKFTAAFEMAGTSAGILAAAFASLVIGSSESLDRYALLILIGCCLGLIGVILTTVIPGGRPRPEESKRAQFAELRVALNDRQFRRFLAGLATTAMTFLPLASFVPLYLRERIGLDAGNVVLLDSAVMAGSFLFSLLWGWTADRYGSKVVLTSGLALLALLPLAWFALPLAGGAGGVIAFLLSFLSGASQIGFYIGSMHLLYNTIIPKDKEGPYMSVYYAWIGLTGGIGPILAGRLIDATGSSYVAFFLGCTGIAVVGLILFRAIDYGPETRVRQFLRFFVYGSPFSAFGLTLRYPGMLNEEQRLAAAERMGQTRNPIHADELVEMLEDPSFNVRYEATLSAGRAPAEPRITNVLINRLKTAGPELRIAVAWALGRIGDRRSIGSLRECLDSDDRVFGSMAARALGMLGDTESLETFVSRLTDPSYGPYKIDYAAAIGSLRSVEGILPIIDVAESLPDNSGAHLELALALSRIIAAEPVYVRLWRGARRDLFQSASRALVSLRRQITAKIGKHTAVELLGAFADSDRERAALLLKGLLEHLEGDAAEPLRKVTAMCSRFLDRKDKAVDAYLLLSLACITLITSPKA